MKKKLTVLAIIGSVFYSCNTDYAIQDSIEPEVGKSEIATKVKSASVNNESIIKNGKTYGKTFRNRSI